MKRLAVSVAAFVKNNMIGGGSASNNFRTLIKDGSPSWGNLVIHKILHCVYHLMVKLTDRLLLKFHRVIALSDRPFYWVLGCGI